MSRQLRLSICAYNPLRNAQATPDFGSARVAQAMEMVKIAKSQGSQLAVLPEISAVAGASGTMQYAEPLDGSCFSKVAETAKKLQMHIAFNHPSLENGKRYNTTALFNPKGQIEGVYHKTNPTIWEIEEKCTPGQGPIVLETKIGRIGFATCYDLNFAKLRAAYRDLNPDFILFPSYFRGGLQCRWWAFETRSYLISSVIDPGSVIVNPVGRVLKKNDCINSIMTQTLELDYKVLHYDYNNLKLDELRKQYGNVIDIDSAEAEGVFLLSSTGDITTDQIIKEMGIEEIGCYFKRASDIIRKANNGEFPNKGPAAWPA